MRLLHISVASYFACSSKLRSTVKQKNSSTLKNSYITEESWNVFLEWVCLFEFSVCRKDMPPQPFIHMLPFSATGMQTVELLD